MDINWNPIQIQQPKFRSAKDVLDQMAGSAEKIRAMRDNDRKYAIDKAMREGLDENGQIDPLKVRRSLIGSGFGENSDQIVSEMMSARRKDVGETVDQGAKIQAYVNAGIITPERARELYNNTQTVTATPTQQIDASWMQGVPSTQTAPADGTGTVDGTVRITAQTDSLPQENQYTRTEKRAQVVPEYASDLFKFERQAPTSLMGTVTSGGNAGIKYAMPTNEDDYRNVERGIKALGYSGPISGIDNYLTELATSQVPVPQFVIKDPSKPMESLAEFQQATANYPALVAAKKADLISKLEGFATKYAAEGRAVAGESRAEQQLVMAQEAQKYALAGQKDTDIFARAVNPTEAADVRRFRSSIMDIATAQPNPESMYIAALAKAKADGSVSQESIMANLAAMGFTPSTAMINTKFLMDGSGNLTSTGMNLLKQAWADLGGKIDAKSFNNWKKTAVDNVNGQLTDAGGKPYTGVTPPPAETPSPVKDLKPGSQKQSAKDVLKSKGVDGKKPSARRQGESYADYLRRTRK